MNKLILLLSLWLPYSVSAEIVVGMSIPTLTIAEKGELIIENQQIAFQPWSSEALAGKLHVVQYLAGRISASKLNEAFTDQLQALALPENSHGVTTILNLDDVMWGTSSFVISELKNKKLTLPHAKLIADENGHGAERWGLQEQSSAIAVISAKGDVLFFKDGALSTEEVSSTLALIQSHIQPQGQPLNQ